MSAQLTARDLFPHGSLGRLGRQVAVFTELDSTNTYLVAHANGLPDGTVVSAEFQSAGRGRLGRQWLAPRGSSILLSILLHEPADSPLVARATLPAALAACDAIDACTVCRPALRWPNDLMLAGRKLGGVLVESVTTTKGRAVVIGLGLNCLQQSGHFTGDLAQTATSLEIESPQPVNRAAIASSLLKHLDTYLAGVEQEPHNWNTLLQRWKSRCADIGTRVILLHDRRQYSGTVLDISHDGDLLVHLDEGGRSYFASASTTRLT
ncbi:MAG: biotin--[acetyl-CoA-carboxylase] ligase [Planctomycetota bacterium]